VHRSGHTEALSGVSRIEFDPTYANAYRSLGFVLHYLKDLPGAVAALEKVAELESLRPFATRNALWRIPPSQPSTGQRAGSDWSCTEA
jgi:hypothetical protein